jgi:hypothetical protein
LSSERPSVELGLVFLGLSALGVGASFAVVLLWATAVGGLPFDDTIIIMVLGPPLAVLAGFIYFSIQGGSLSIPSLAAVIGTSAGAAMLGAGVYIWFNPFALWVAPPAITFGSYLLLAAFENPRRHLWESTYVFALGSGSAVLLGATLFSGGLFWPRLYAPFVLLPLLAAVILVWSSRYIISRRRSRL